MNIFLKGNLSLILFSSIPIIFLWHPNWMGLLGIQPYWPLFLLLPWSLVHGSLYGAMAGLFLGLILDSVALSNSLSQIPGLILCGFWFGRISKSCNDVFIEHFRYGLVCVLGSFLCGIVYFIQILMQNMSYANFGFFVTGIKNILVQVFLTGFFAPLICSQLFRIIRSAKKKNL